MNPDLMKALISVVVLYVSGMIFASASQNTTTVKNKNKIMDSNYMFWMCWWVMSIAGFIIGSITFAIHLWRLLS